MPFLPTRSMTHGDDFVLAGTEHFLNHSANHMEGKLSITGPERRGVLRVLKRRIRRRTLIGTGMFTFISAERANCINTACVVVFCMSDLCRGCGCASDITIHEYRCACPWHGLGTTSCLVHATQGEEPLASRGVWFNSASAEHVHRRICQ